MRRLFFALALTMPLVLLTGTGAQAIQAPSPNVEGDAFTLVGSGEFSPGLAVDSCSRSVFLGGDAVVLGDEFGTYSMEYGGSSTQCETQAAGAGSGSLSIIDSSGFTVGGGTVNYVRNGTTGLALAGVITFNNETHYFDAHCEWEFVDNGGEMFFQVACAGVWQVGLT